MAHHITEDGKIYVDTKFLNFTSRVPGLEVRHMGFGEFALDTPKGEVQVDRMRGVDFPGQSGRSHQLYDKYPSRAAPIAEWVIKQMEAKGASDRVASTYSYNRTKQAFVEDIEIRQEALNIASDIADGEWQVVDERIRKLAREFDRAATSGRLDEGQKAALAGKLWNLCDVEHWWCVKQAKLAEEWANVFKKARQNYIEGARAER
jgi:hypothetical protein